MLFLSPWKRQSIKYLSFSLTTPKVYDNSGSVERIKTIK